MAFFFVAGILAFIAGGVLLFFPAVQNWLIEQMVRDRMNLYDSVSESRILRSWLFLGKRKREDAEQKEWETNRTMFRYVFPIFLLIWGGIAIIGGIGWLLD